MVHFCYLKVGCFKVIYALPLAVTLSLSFISYIKYVPPVKPAGWLSINTSLPLVKSSYDGYYHNKALIQKVTNLIATNLHLVEKLKLILLPELVVTEWDEATKFLWRNVSEYAETHDVTVLIGTKKYLNKQEYIEGIEALGVGQGIFLPDRVPVPISMWRPWSQNPTAKQYWFHSGIRNIVNTKVATSICYEQLLVWPILYSFLYKPEVLLASSNVWWAKGTNISSLQQEALLAWSQLFSIPILKAINI
jgi:apolipoprotein N-acyltransferase